MQLVKSSMHKVQHDHFSQVKRHAGAETKSSAYNHVEIRKRGGPRKRQQKLSEKLKRVRTLPTTVKFWEHTSEKKNLSTRCIKKIQ